MTKQLAINLKIFSDKQIYFHIQNGIKNKMSSYIGIGFVSKWTTKTIFISLD